MADQFYVESGWVDTSYYTSVSDAASVIDSTFDLQASLSLATPAIEFTAQLDVYSATTVSVRVIRRTSITSAITASLDVKVVGIVPAPATTLSATFDVDAYYRRTDYMLIYSYFNTATTTTLPTPGVPYGTYTAGKWSNALKLVGDYQQYWLRPSNDVIVNYDEYCLTNVKTIEGWINVPTNIGDTVTDMFAFDNNHNISPSNLRSVKTRIWVSGGLASLQFWNNIDLYTTAVSITIGVWNHVAYVVSDNNVISCYLNGTRLLSTQFGQPGVNNIPYEFRLVGTGSNTNRRLNFDEIRISSTQRYDPAATTITVPSAPFSNDASTIALFHLDSSVQDAFGNTKEASSIFTALTNAITIGTKKQFVSSVIDCNTTLFANLSKLQAGNATLNAITDVSTSTGRIRSAQIVCDPLFNDQTSASLTRTGIATLASICSLSATSQRVSVTNATIYASADVISNIGIKRGAISTIDSQSGLSVDVYRVVFASAQLSAQSSVSSSLIKLNGSPANLSAISDVTSSAVSKKSGISTIGTTASLSTEPFRIFEFEIICEPLFNNSTYISLTKTETLSITLLTDVQTAVSIRRQTFCNVDVISDVTSSIGVISTTQFNSVVTASLTASNQNIVRAVIICEPLFDDNTSAILTATGIANIASLSNVFVIGERAIDAIAHQQIESDLICYSTKINPINSTINCNFDNVTSATKLTLMSNKGAIYVESNGTITAIPNIINNHVVINNIRSTDILVMDGIL